MKKTFVAMFTLLAASLAWAASPYTLKNLQPSTKDLTTQTNSINAWKLIGGIPHCKAGTLVSALGGQYCIQADGYVYKFNSKTHAWDKQTAMGTPYAIALSDTGNIFALIHNACASPNYGVYVWGGSSWTATSGCGTQIAAGYSSLNPAVTMLAVINSSNNLYFSTNKGSTWNLQSGSWSSVSLSAPTYLCQIDTSHNMWAGNYGQPLDELPAIPSVNGTVIGCLWATPPTVIMAWTSTGHVYSMPLENFGTWQAVAGISAQLITGVDRFHVFAEDTSNNVYHWNVNAPSISAEYGGAWSSDLGCPSPGAHCLATTQHKVTSRLYFKSGHGLDGKQRSATNTYNFDIETHPLDTNPQCDPVFGIIDDFECTANFEATDMCEQSNQQIGSADVNYIVDDSIDDLDFSYNNGYAGPMTVTQGPNGGYILGQIDNVFHEDCWTGDPVPVCPADANGNTLVINNREDWLGGALAHEVALSEWNVLQNDHIAGITAPYIYHSFYWAILNPDGTIDFPICFGGWTGQNDFLWGNYDARPHCK